MRYVLEALQKLPNEKLFHFGKVALEQFRGRLMEWPQYCAHLVQIPHFRTAFPDLVAELELNLSKLSPKDVSSGNRDASGNDSMTLGEAFGKSFPPPPTKSEMLASTNNVPTPPLSTSSTTSNTSTSQQQAARFLQHQPSPLQLPGMVGSNTMTSPPIVTVTTTATLQEPPPTKVMDDPHRTCLERRASVDRTGTERAVEILTKLRISTIRDEQFDKGNFTKKQNRSRSCAPRRVTRGLKPHRKRVATQASFHPVYVEFLNKMNSKRLTDLVVECAVNQIRQLIYSLSLRVDSAKRNLLKTLGSWLGKITLARNKPVLQKKLDLKGLLYDAYQRGRLHVVLPSLQGSCQ